MFLRTADELGVIPDQLHRGSIELVAGCLAFGHVIFVNQCLFIASLVALPAGRQARRPCSDAVDVTSRSPLAIVFVLPALPGGLAVATPDATIGVRIGFVAAQAAQNRGRYRQSADPRLSRPPVKPKGELV